MNNRLTVIFFLLISTVIYSQELINKLGWLEGKWVTDKWGGTMEEYWSAPSGNTIIGMYRFTIGDSLNFTEHFMIVEENNKLTMKLKHFDKDFNGWEEKDEYVEFPFIEMNEKSAKFDGIEYELVSGDTLKAYVNLDSDGEGKIEEFIYKRVK